MRIVDATARLVRAPEVCFAASEIGLAAFGHNIENRHLMAALDARAEKLTSLSRGSSATSYVTLLNWIMGTEVELWSELPIRWMVSAQPRGVMLCHSAPQ